MNQISNISTASLQQKGFEPIQSKGVPQKTFSEWLSDPAVETHVNQLLDTPGHIKITELESALKVGKAIGPRELLLYQVRVGQLGMRVELVSRMAESLTATVRRLQNGGQ